MSFASPTAGPSGVDQVFAQAYDTTFVEFVRHVVGQGVPVNERVMDAAHERATKAGITASNTHGYRSADFAGLTRSGLARMRARYGY